MSVRTAIGFMTVVTALTATADAHASPVAPATQAHAPLVVAPLAPPSMVAPHDPETPTPPTAVSQWYGWQILVADGTVLGLAVATRSSGVAYGCLGSGAVVHWTRGNVGRGLASVALRVGL